MSDVVDFVGVGIGPANLSLAALAARIPHSTSEFFEARSRFEWHPGLLFRDAMIQVSYVKDLVTLIDPTSPYSFLAFLHRSGRMYRFITAGFPRVLRAEFDQYFRWVAEQLPNLVFGDRIRAIDFDGKSFTVSSDAKRIRARHVVLGTGLAPAVPAFAKGASTIDVLHASEFLTSRPSICGRRIAVIGGGQTGAEIVLHLLSEAERLPRHVTWIGRRDGFLPIDDSTFTNELFFPAHVRRFVHWSRAQRLDSIARNILASDGISLSTLTAIYQRMYVLDYIENGPVSWQLLPHSEAIDLHRRDDAIAVSALDRTTGTAHLIDADVVIFATGYRYEIPECLDPIIAKIEIESDGQLCINEDYSVAWMGPSDNRIYVQNGAQHRHGIADPNLSLMAWRSAVVLNSIYRRTVYETESAHSTFGWSAPTSTKR